MPNYTVGLCAMGEHGLLAPPYETHDFEAVDDAHAGRKGMALAKTMAGMIGDRTWVQVLNTDRKAVFSEELESPI
jgi:hypothetical protein